MSYILDALKKSERERHASLPPSAGASPSAGALAAPPWQWLAIGALVTVTTFVLVWLLWPSSPTEPPGAPASAENAVRDLAGQVRATPATRAGAPATARLPESSEIPFLRGLPDELRRSLPEMTVNIHVYAPDEKARLLYINNKEYKRGEFISGVLIEDIAPDGVLMNYHGVRYKLERPR